MGGPPNPNTRLRPGPGEGRRGGPGAGSAGKGAIYRPTPLPAGAEGKANRPGTRARPRGRRDARPEPAEVEAGEAAGPRPQQAAEWPYCRFPTDTASRASETRVSLTCTGSCSTVILEAQAHFLQCLRPPP